MGQDPYRKTQRGGANLGGIAMVFVAVVVGLLLSGSVLWYETGQRAADQVAAVAAPATPIAAPAAPSAAPAALGSVTAAPAAPAAIAAPTAPKATSAPAQASAATTAPTAVPSKPAGAPVAAAAGSADAGSKLFTATCDGCHPGGRAGLGPSLKGVSAEEVTKTVMEGKDMMPSFGPSQISDQQLRDIIAYLASL